MRNLLAFFGAVTLTVLGLGWYLGWYHVKSEPAPNGHRGVSIDINTGKIGADIKTGTEKFETMIDKKTQESPPVTIPNPTTTPAPKQNIDGNINFQDFRRDN
jgi:hypothetical protein